MDKYIGKYFSIETNFPDKLKLYYSKELDLYKPIDMIVLQKIAEENGFIVNPNKKVVTINKEKMKLFSRLITYVIAEIEPSEPKITLFSPEIIPMIIDYGKETQNWDDKDKGVIEYLKKPYLEFLKDQNPKYLVGI